MMFMVLKRRTQDTIARTRSMGREATYYHGLYRHNFTWGLMDFKMLCQGEDEIDLARQFRDCLSYIRLTQVVKVLVLRPFDTAFLELAASAFIIRTTLDEKLSGLRQARYATSKIF